jgi:carboxylate-amine ligase
MDATVVKSARAEAAGGPALAVPAPVTPFGRPFDERLAAPQEYAGLLDRFPPPALAAEAELVASALATNGVIFGGSDPRPFDVDVVPRIISGPEWERLEAGIRQRVRALNAFVGDAYTEGRASAAGIVPDRVLFEADWYEPAMAAPDMPVPVATVAGPDVVRAPDGELLVLEDNLRAPSGLSYLLAARRALEPLARACDLRPRSLEPVLDALGQALRRSAPATVEDPFVVLVNDGPGASAFYEHRALAEALGMTIATTADLRREEDRLLLEDRVVDVVYRRVDDERLLTPDGVTTRLGDLLIEPMRAGRLGCANSPGTGIADDKAVHLYVEPMIRFFLGEEPLLRSAPGYDLGDADQLAEVLPRLGELVIKPRSDFGGLGIVVGPLAARDELDRAAAAVREAPHRFVAQEPIALSVHPTLLDGELGWRHVDLRPFVVTAGEQVTVAAGGLSRFARAEGEMIVNSGRGGGAKDTWVI